MKQDSDGVISKFGSRASVRQCLVFVSDMKKYCCSLGSVLERNVSYGWEVLDGASGGA